VKSSSKYRRCWYPKN